MSITHIPFYPSDWLAGTRALSAEETGVYITLIARMYEMAGPIERDDARLSRLCGCKTKPGFVRCLEYLIEDGKITETQDGLFNDRVQKEIEKVVKISQAARDAAEVRWKKKSNKINAGNDAPASQPHMRNECQPEPEPELVKEEAKASSQKKRGTRLSNDWALPRDWGEWAVSQGWPEQVVRIEADKFRDYWISTPGQKGVKLDWLATWRNWMRNCNSPKIVNGVSNGKSSQPDPQLDAIAIAARMRRSPGANSGRG